LFEFIGPQSLNGKRVGAQDEVLPAADDAGNGQADAQNRLPGQLRAQLADERGERPKIGGRTRKGQSAGLRARHLAGEIHSHQADMAQSDVGPNNVPRAGTGAPGPGLASAGGTEFPAGLHQAVALQAAQQSNGRGRAHRQSVRHLLCGKTFFFHGPCSRLRRPPALCAEKIYCLHPECLPPVCGFTVTHSKHFVKSF